jgi:large subunit ribosomal protein L19
MAAASHKTEIEKVEASQLKKNIPSFRVGDTIKVHAKIVEGNKERIQIFEGIVIKKHRKNDVRASFTVRKVSYNVGVERTFLLHSPRIDKIQVVSKGHVRRARLFYLRPLRGKASRIHSEIVADNSAIEPVEVAKAEPVIEKTNGNKEEVPAAQESAV